MILNMDLLSEIFNQKVVSYRIDKNEVMVQFSDYGVVVSIYELAHKCKEWALGQGYYFDVSLRLYNDEYECRVKIMHGVTTDENVDAETEPKAIFKACEWILKKIK